MFCLTFHRNVSFLFLTEDSGSGTFSGTLPIVVFGDVLGYVPDLPIPDARDVFSFASSRS